MIPKYLFDYPWIPAIAWLVIYTSDYYLTLWGARLYRAQDIFELSGSYELTPGYVNDVDKQVKFSPKFFIWLITGSLLLLIVSIFARELPLLYGAYVGYMLFMELALHVRHFSNICMYRALINDKDCGVTGHVRTSRAWNYRISAVQLFAFSIFTFLAYAMTNSCILLGGGIGILALANVHRRLWRKETKAEKCRVEAENPG